MTMPTQSYAATGPAEEAVPSYLADTDSLMTIWDYAQIAIKYPDLARECFNKIKLIAHLAPSMAIWSYYKIACQCPGLVRECLIEILKNSDKADEQALYAYEVIAEKGIAESHPDLVAQCFNKS